MDQFQRVTRPAVVAEARAWIGTPYRHQASLKGVGCDCLGLVRGVWRTLLGPEPEFPPPYSRRWGEAERREALADAARKHLVEIDPADARPGDVLLFRWRPHLPARHCAVASDRNEISAGRERRILAMVHAHDGAVVAEVALGPWWRRHLAYAFTFPGIDD